MFEYDLNQLLEKFPLPDGVEDAIVNRAELAEALNKSANTIDDYRKKNMPMHTEGGNGTAYEFKLSECWAWYHGWKEREAEIGVQKKSAITQLRMALLNSDGDELSSLSPNEQKAVYEAEKAYMDSAYNRGILIKRSDVIRGLETLFALFKQQYETLPDILERTVSLTPAEIDEVVKLAEAQQEIFFDTVRDSELLENKDAEQMKAAQ